MNEITRIHLAKTAYDIEIAAKKQLEKYIKSLESYTQDQDVLTDIEIRITELLLEQGVQPNGVIGTEDVAAIRKQLGEPYEFAEQGEGDIAVGIEREVDGRRLYRSTDNAVLGGVLSGAAAYFNVNPLWTRLVFILLLFISFGFASLVYILAWILIPAARTATEKLRLNGKEVTLESIKSLNADEETVQPNRVAPLLQRIFATALGILSAVGAAGAFMVTVWLIISASMASTQFMELTNGFAGLGDDNAWIVWLVFGIVLFGLALLIALLSLTAYAFFTRRFTKRMLVSAIIITVLGLASFASTIAISTTQSWRVANESRSMVREKKANLPNEFSSITSLKIHQKFQQAVETEQTFLPQYAAVRYVVDDGPARYELTSLPTVKAAITIEGTQGVITIDIPNSFRNSFTQPLLTVYGPAVERITTDEDTSVPQFSYDGRTQSKLTIDAHNENAAIVTTGSYETLTVKGTGSVDITASTVRSLIVESSEYLSVIAGTVSTLVTTVPDACPQGGDNYATSVSVADIASGKLRYNGSERDAKTIETSCSIVRIESLEDDDDVEYNRY